MQSIHRSPRTVYSHPHACKRSKRGIQGCPPRQTRRHERRFAFHHHTASQPGERSDDGRDSKRCRDVGGRISQSAVAGKEEAMRNAHWRPSEIDHPNFTGIDAAHLRLPSGQASARPRARPDCIRPRQGPDWRFPAIPHEWPDARLRSASGVL